MGKPNKVWCHDYFLTDIFSHRGVTYVVVAHDDAQTVSILNDPTIRDKIGVESWSEITIRSPRHGANILPLTYYPELNQDIIDAILIWFDRNRYGGLTLQEFLDKTIK